MDFSKVLLIVLALLGVSLADDPPKNCHQYIEFIISGKTVPNITEVLPFIMYSGITSNNPGQKYECEHTIGFKNNYFLIDWKNSTNDLDIFTGICVPSFCSKEEIQTSLHQYPQIKNSKVYDYPADPETDSLLVFCTVIFGIWVGILTIWSIFVSCRAPMENQLIKKNEQIKTPDDGERAINALSQQRVASVKQDFKLFNFYQGYCRIFKKSKNISLMAPILFLATFSIIFSMEFSFRQNIAANEVKALRWFDSFGGLMFCNVQIAFSVIIFIFGVKLATSLHKLGSFHEIGRFFFDDLLVKWASLFFISLFSFFFIGFTDEPLNKLWREQTTEQCPSTLYQLWFLFRGLKFDGKACMPWLWVLQSEILLSLLAAPFYIIYKTKKSLGYILFSLIIFTAILVGYAVLDNQSVVFEPYKIFNMPNEYSINYQSSTIIRMSPFFIGILFGLFVSEGIDKPESQQNKGFVKSIRRNQKLQLGLHIVGASLMIAMYLLIIPYLKIIQADETRSGAYGYIIFAPLGFLAGLMLFMLPCLWQGESKLTVILNKVFHAGFWGSLDKMIIGFLTMGPVVIGFTTYSMQNSIYFDFETVFIYFLGDAVILYVLALVVVSGLVMQLQFISKWLQSKLFKQESKYSVLILQD